MFRFFIADCVRDHGSAIVEEEMEEVMVTPEDGDEQGMAMNISPLTASNDDGVSREHIKADSLTLESISTGSRGHKSKSGQSNTNTKRVTTPLPHQGGNGNIDVIREDIEELHSDNDGGLSHNKPEAIQYDSPSTNLAAINSKESNYISEDKQLLTPSVDSTTILQSTYSEDTQISMLEIEEQMNTMNITNDDLYGVEETTKLKNNASSNSTPSPANNNYINIEKDNDPLTPNIDRAQTTNISVDIENETRPSLKQHKSLADAKQLIVAESKEDSDENKEDFDEDARLTITIKDEKSHVQKQLFLARLEEPKEKMPELGRASTDLSIVPSASNSINSSISIPLETTMLNKYSKDDLAMTSIKLKDEKGNKGNNRKFRHQSLSIRYGKGHGSDKGNKHNTVDSNSGFDKLGSRMRNQSQILQHHIRSKSKKMKSEMMYHMREASNSMQIRNKVLDKLQIKKNQQFNVLDCKGFSSICTKLYYKYVATGIAPLEVNISSSTRARCKNIFTADGGAISRTSSLRGSRNVSRNNSLRGSPKSGAGTPTNGIQISNKRARTISKEVVSILSSKKASMMRNGALDVLRETNAYNGGMGLSSRTKSSKKLQMMNNPEEPFNGDIVMAMSQLLPPLEQCAIELTNLLKDSLARFKKTRSCTKLYEDYNERREAERYLENRR